MWATLSDNAGIYGVFGCALAAVLGLRMLLIAVVALWSLTADDDGRSHALALIRTITTLPRVARATRTRR